jgi:hypothetical protein
MNQLINDLERDDLLNLEPVAIDTARIRELTTRKLTASLGTQPGASHAVRFKTLVAACIMVGTLLAGTAAYAVGSALIVGENPLDFWFSFTSQDVAELPEGGVPIYGETLPNMEDFNVAIEQTITAEGVAVSFDSVAIDDNFVTVFFTYRFDEPVDLKTAVAQGYADVNALRMFIGQPTITLEGLTLAAAGMGAGYEAKDSTAYFAENEAGTVDARVVKTATRYLIPSMLPDDLSLNLTVTPTADGRHVFTSAVPEALNFTLALDKSAASPYTRIAEAGNYEFTIEGEVWTLDVEKFAVSPFGAVLVIDPHEGESADSGAAATATSGSTDTSTDSARYLGLRDISLLDQDGATLRLLAPESAQQAGVRVGYVIPAQAAARISSIVIQPSVSAPHAQSASYAVTDIGARMPTGPDRGLILRDYQVAGNTIRFACEPYGTPLPTRLDDPAIYGMPANSGQEVYLPELIIDDSGLDPASLLGRAEYGLDPETGLYLYTLSFYTADEALLRQISSFHVVYSSGEPSFDSTQSLTLNLQAK